MMRARNRHSASNYLFAAFLELVIMGIFVVIAQPQLRESLFELLEPPARALAAPAEADSTATVRDARYGADYSARDYACEAATQQPAIAQTPAALNAALSPNAGRWSGQPAGWSMTTASYTPFEQFESFAVSSSGATVSASPASLNVEKRVAGYAPSAGPTQLSAIDWNIADAGQSPRPLSGWTPSRPAQAEYRDTYPPPYGTQSQWK